VLGLPPRPPLVELPSGVCAVGFALDDYEAAVQAAAGFEFSDLPQQAVLKRRAEFLAGRLAAVSALRALGVAGRPVRREDGSPVWPAAAVGSISHGAGRALCVVARSSEFRSLGIDAERLLDTEMKTELGQRICFDRERELLGGLLGVPDHERVSLAFSVKESLYKCLYPHVGRFMDFHAAEVVAARGQRLDAMLAGELTLRLRQDWSEAFRAGHELMATFALAADHVETAVALRV
jgi:enterobactin synthetase component D